MGSSNRYPDWVATHKGAYPEPCYSLGPEEDPLFSLTLCEKVLRASSPAKVRFIRMVSATQALRSGRDGLP